MDYFKRLLHLLHTEKEEDRRQYRQLMESVPVADRREAGLTWYPVAIRETEIGRGDYLTIELERTTHTDDMHQLRFGMSAALFSNHDPRQDRIEGVISHISGNRLKLSLRVDDLPDWSRNGKLGVDAVFDENSYAEMENALRLAPAITGQKEKTNLIAILTGGRKPEFYRPDIMPEHTGLNAQQAEAVTRILGAQELAIVHGPPGTGKTTTLVQAVKALAKDGPVLVTAPSNTAVDLLSQRLHAQGLNVVRVGNPARVSEEQLALTLDSRIAVHPSFKEIRRLRRQAAEYRDLAQKYKRSFGREEREQRKALFTEARNIMKEVERTEQYISEDVLSKAQVITATLVGANHYSVRHLQYHTVVIDEAGQALEPACWVAILKGRKLVMAGDHFQLPPTVKSVEAAREGLASTLMEKCVALHPEAVVLLEEQYRMHEQIMGFSSAEFYGGRLQAHPSVAGHTLFPGDQPLLFVDTAGCGFDELVEGTRISNPEEARMLIRHLEGLAAQQSESGSGAEFPSIALISPYRKQVELLQELVRQHPRLSALPRLSINTIDGFQGQERDVVYISMVRSNSDSTIGFLADIRRMNVAMTRARKKLVVVGDSATLAQDPFYSDFITYAQERNGYLSAWELMDY